MLITISQTDPFVSCGQDLLELLDARAEWVIVPSESSMQSFIAQLLGLGMVDGSRMPKSPFAVVERISSQLKKESGGQAV